ncbi:ScbA/BarX family gamma-butyrolactone biosynthesis protein [Streptomyces sp. NPDC002812]|uniref:ScbA/BarX family gamma-butyrolactone biosynthesis protein n=1 Tax=unclassified Streptomyces TaxID=2593676 RepID=UPI002030FDE9|nr:MULTISPECIES: ScbA/BarX family gamma-butyrolactone biosynthesis protein [unclassified Streptomyces]MCM1970628.1 ScbA protein [Streptomyces sp. G1]MCX5130437.1 ScbA/BarX family gamma-butyrolactone biosynthesis protein [Streptomyces sp. NBC_00347]MCX5301818.1 ScbA/BarX family gamma-butyrolactone biosynthesis protein [Streptomyces sp. NBC_00193]
MLITSYVSENAQRPSVGVSDARPPAVPNWLVHRPDTSEVFLSTWERTAPDRFNVTVRWPENHPFHTALHGFRSPAVIAEAIRQTGILLSHAEYGVPLGHQFLMSDIRYRIDPELLAADSGAPVHIDVTCTNINRRGTRFSGMVCHMDVVQGGRVIATGGGSLTCTSPGAYRRMRGEYADARPLLPVPDPVQPSLVLRTDPSHVLLAPTMDPRCWTLRPHTTNTTLFAHKNDHVPGMVLLEATHQAAYAVAGATRLYPTSLRLTFDRYVEFHSPCLVQAQPVTRSRDNILSLNVTGHQSGQRVFHAHLEAIPVSA